MTNDYEGLIPSLGLKYDFKNKDLCIENSVKYMLARTNHIVKYKNLPDSILHRYTELLCQTEGFYVVINFNDKLRVVRAGLGGEEDENYMPTLAIVANPGLNCFKEFKIYREGMEIPENADDYCVVIPNDSLYSGLLPIMQKWATLLAENELSMSINDILSRVLAIISANDDNTAKSAKKFLDDVVKGTIGVVEGNVFTEGITTSNFSNNAKSSLTDLIEVEQYCKASWFNELGLNANYNMKRESINGNEADLNNDSLMPLIDDMLICRQQGWKEVEQLFGVHVEVSLDGAWLDNQIEINEEQAAISGNEEVEDPSVKSETKLDPEVGQEDNKEESEGNEDENKEAN